MLQLNPKKARPAALLVMCAGLLLVTCVAPCEHQLLTPLLHLSAGQQDFVHGFSIGLGLSMEIAAVVVLARLHRGCSRASQAN